MPTQPIVQLLLNDSSEQGPLIVHVRGDLDRVHQILEDADALKFVKFTEKYGKPVVVNASWVMTARQVVA